MNELNKTFDNRVSNLLRKNFSGISGHEHYKTTNIFFELNLMNQNFVLFGVVDFDIKVKELTAAQPSLSPRRAACVVTRNNLIAVTTASVVLA